MGLIGIDKYSKAMEFAVSSTFLICIVAVMVAVIRAPFASKALRFRRSSAQVEDDAKEARRHQINASCFMLNSLDGDSSAKVHHDREDVTSVSANTIPKPEPFHSDCRRPKGDN